MNTIIRQLIVTFLSSLVICGAALAQSNTSISTNQNTPFNNTQTTENSHKANEWGLKAEEWERYKALMDGPLGIYSPGIDPLTALGVSARSDEERRRYAELQVIAESARIERELAYQRAYDEAFKRLYPNILPIDFTSTPSLNSVIPSSNSRLAVFVRDNCEPCMRKVQELQRSGLAFDVYMVGSNGDDKVIRRWAMQTEIDPQKVFSRFITLNHDAGRLQLLSIDGDLPAVLIEVNGQWQRQ